MKLFLYESLSAGGLGDDAPASLRAEGRAMLAAAAGDFAAVAEVATLLHIDTPAIPGIQCLRTNTNDEPRRFLDALDACDAALIIAPEFDGILARRSERIVERGQRLLGCRPEAIRATADKLTLAQQWLQLGVPTPVTSLASAALPSSFPVVLKPRDGAGSQATHFVARPESWARAFEAASIETPGWDLIAQPFHSGKSCSIAFLIGPRQTLPLVAAQQRLSDDGRFQYRGGRLPLSLDESRRAVALASAAVAAIDGLAGYVGVDLILGDDGNDVAIEINPRLTTSYIGLRAFCRDNLADAWLRVLDGECETGLTWREGAIEFLADGRVVGSQLSG